MKDINYVCPSGHKWVGGINGNYCPVCAHDGFEDETEAENAHEVRLDVGWPGDGSGTDDLADYNANEADDYRDE